MTEPIAILSDLRFCDHIVPAGFPESPARIQEIHNALSKEGFPLSGIHRVEPRIADDNALRLAHTEEFVARLNATDWNNARFFDAEEVPTSPKTFETARLAVGGVLSLIDKVMSGEVKRGFAAIRPPGHHSSSDHTEGFCLVNNVAIAARHLIHHHNLNRVLIVDWDVHHGNGTQQILEADNKVMFCSIHGDPREVYPGTGFANEQGKGGGKVCNVPIPQGSDDDLFRDGFRMILQQASLFQPEFVLISAGFDAHKDDPMEVLKVETETYGWMTEQLIRIANQSAQGRIVSLLEGGYNVTALAESVVRHVLALRE